MSDVDIEFHYFTPSKSMFWLQLCDELYSTTHTNTWKQAQESNIDEYI